MKADTAIVEEVRSRRRQISERFAHDLRAYTRHLREIQEKFRDRHPIVNQVTVVSREKT